MTVKDLIEKLNEVENKDLSVLMWLDHDLFDIEGIDNSLGDVVHLNAKFFVGTFQ